jgi:rhodanese-related sulfurtransferase
MTRFIAAPNVASMLANADEVAFLDTREIVPFSAGHPLLATNLPLSCMELSIGKLVPRPATPIVVTDGEGECAPVAAERLRGLGYSNVAVLEGGAAGWAASGEALFPEIEVAAKGFGAFAKRHGRPNLIEAAELDRALRSGEDWLVLDSRPRDEYQAGNIPGSTNAPGADLVRRFDDLVPDASTRVVVNCMSHTRGILGGLSLMAAGVPNEIRVLNHGTRGWLLEGFELETGADRFPGPASAEAIGNARKRTADIAERAGIARIDAETLDRWHADPDRTTYIFDVRTPGEYRAGHLPGSRNAPEGSLVMASGHYFATLNARFVLVDDDTIRAAINALWLSQMGWGEVAVLDGGIAGHALETGPEPADDPEPDIGTVRQMTAHELGEVQDGQAIRIIDVGTSDSYVDGHLPDAIWCARVALAEFLEKDPHDGLTVLTSVDGAIARLAASDLDDPSSRDIAVLTGGNRAWHESGHELSKETGRLASPRDDHFLRSSERPGDTRRNVIDYLDWEVTLLDDIERGGPVPYSNRIWR